MPRQETTLWRSRLIAVLAYQAPVLIIIGLAMLTPLLLAAWDARGAPTMAELRAFLLPASIALLLGFATRYRRPPIATLSPNAALLVTTASWLTIGFLGALPFVILLDTPPVDAVLESVSGFTTAGTTMLTGLDGLPRSIIIWRALIQWLGGLGILLIILLVSQTRGSSAVSLLNAEGVKISSGRLSFNFRRAAIRFIIIYFTLTGAQIIITWLLGMSLFDAISHAMTTVSTGGFSPHDQSISYYRSNPEQYPLYIWLELVIAVFMLAGGVNFYVLYRLGRGQLRALWDGIEMRILWLVLGSATLMVTVSAWLNYGGSRADWLLRSLFEVASLISTTGYETTATGSFPVGAREIFLVLMVLGGCAGSTAGGIKLVRLGLLAKFLSHEVRALRLPSHAIHRPTLDGRPISDVAFRQSVFILLLWLAYLWIGGFAISWMAPDLQIGEAFSIVFSAIGVFGPSFTTVQRVIELPDAAKIILTVGMLAGRLEILPLLVFFNLNAWRK